MTTSVDWVGAADRLELIYSTLTADTFGAKTVTVNHAAAIRAIAYCRHLAARGKHSDDSELEMIHFLGQHNQSLDWAFFGDLGAMILAPAMHTNSVRRPSPAVSRAAEQIREDDCAIPGITEFSTGERGVYGAAPLAQRRS